MKKRKNNMKKSLYLIALSAAVVAGCNLNETKLNPDVPMVERPMPEITYEGSGNLVTGTGSDQKTLASTFSWSAKDDAIVVNVDFDLTEYIDNNGWELGYFFLDVNSINDFTGMLITSDTNESNFYGVEPNGSKVDYGDSHAVWTSYKPGMWFNADGTASGSGGLLYWQWYVWTGRDGIYYDYGEGTDKAFNGLFLVGGNPGNVAGNAAKLVGTTSTSKARLETPDGNVDFIVNVKFTNYDASDDGWDHNDAQTALSGTANLMLDRDTESTFPLTWNISKEGIDFTCELSVAKLCEEEFGMAYEEGVGYVDGPYAIGYVKFDLDIFTDVIGKKITETTAEEFFPCDAEGNQLTKRYTMSDGALVEGDFTGWTAQPPLPGEWVLADGRAGNWSSGAAYWWLNFDQEHYAEVMCEGALCIGNGPNAVHQIGDTVTSYAMCCGVPFKVTVKYVE